ncbi:MAG: hypothetical protein C0434_02895 [Xanthomonadaceae bacterium]|nr:hypothetical protein [Xanthomonadaceae bacterium]
MIGLPVAVLSAPALLLAGTAASVHCAAMCGALSAQQTRASGGLPPITALLLLHGGRVVGYAALGALAGGIGQGLLRHLPDPSFGQALQVLAAALLVGIGVRLLIQRPAMLPACCLPAARNPKPCSPVGVLLRGVLWAALPCALLYSVLLLAALSGTVLDGAVLAGAFALGGTPLLALVGWRSRSAGLRQSAGWWLIAVGLLSLAATAFLSSDALRNWCAAPTPVTAS